MSEEREKEEGRKTKSIPAYVLFRKYLVLKPGQYPEVRKLFSRQDYEHPECQYSFLHKNFSQTFLLLYQPM